MKKLDEQVLKKDPESKFKSKTILKAVFFPIYLIYLVGRDMFEETNA